MKRALETERLSLSLSLSLSLWELYEGKLEGGLLYLGPQRIRSVRLWKWASVSIVDPFWEIWGGRFFLSEELFIQEFKRHVKEGTGNGQLSPQVPPLGSLEVVRLPGGLGGR